MSFGRTILRLARYSAGHCKRDSNSSRYFSFTSYSYAEPHVCIIGSGPAGFYTAQHLLKHNKKVRVDIFEKLPVPYGLVRFGVAPDHPEVKNVINSFEEVASDSRCRFFGNISVGVDVATRNFLESYDAVVLAYGAEDDRMLNIKGEDLNGVYSAREFVGWYNGLPLHKDLNPNLDCENVAVVGQGNVALDIARILLAPLDLLKKTDICKHAFKLLEKSLVKRVFIIGRRGPMEVSFTIKETREMIKLEGTKPILLANDFELLKTKSADVPRPRKRLMELLCKTACDEPASKEIERRSNADREWQLMFNRSPVEIIPSENQSDSLLGLKLEVNERIEENGSVKAVGTGKYEVIPSGIVIRSIGYKSIPMEDYIPFDKRIGVIPNIAGRVVHHHGANEVFEGLYCSGWVKHGPVGVIVTTMAQAKETGDTILEDLKSGQIKVKNGNDRSQSIITVLQEKGIRHVTFSDWRKINEEEISRGKNANKPREKLIDEKEMLAVAFKNEGK